MKNLLIASVLLLGAPGALTASQAQKSVGFDADAVAKLADSYTQQGYTEINTTDRHTAQEEFDAMQLVDKNYVNKMLAKMSTYLVETTEKGEGEGLRNHIIVIILNVNDGSRRFFIKKSLEKANGNDNE